MLTRSLSAALLAFLVAVGFVRQTASPPIDRAALAAQVRSEFKHAWDGYKKYAWGHDELLPMSKGYRDWYKGETLYMTPVDALDTMILMKMSDEAEKTKAYLLANLSFDKDIEVKNFEITIRILGGLLSAYQMTGERRFLTMAEDLANRLAPVFNAPTGMPYMYVNLKSGTTRGAETNPAEIGTLILEFGTLARLTKKEAFFDKAKKAIVEVYNRRDPKTGLIGQGINVETGEWTSRSSHIGGGIDSYYEYLAKCERLFGDKECGTMAREGLGAVNKYLADETSNGLWYGVADMTTGQRTRTTFGSLQAFLPSVLAFTGDLDRARRLEDSAFRMWTLNGVEPEGIDYSAMRVTSAGYQLRPEIMESAYYLYHYTKDPRYLEMGRTFLRDLIQYCRTDDGYTVLRSVVTKEKGDLMHSFLLAETFKYLYLLFSPDALDFDKVVFNTEAHPLEKKW
jgi:mannosidase alpha-like ER degradation enhancer 2